jgi:diaminohydroxyphosphoribosylaminopyrimidine deaminase/5-amino-6-(5-phosphoribosylamino)uracil reductase
MSQTPHEHYMQRCLELAANGLREAMPNPSVGAVLVHDGRIIGEGHTSPFGGPHGEVNCLNSVLEADRHLIPKATLYVSLEPCSHYGKTPPCCDLIIKNEIQDIVIGCVDPNEKVAGNGIRKLQEAGKNVTVGVLEAECREFNHRFFTFHEKQRPYIILKWAESADGFLSPSNRLLDDSMVRSFDSSNNPKIQKSNIQDVEQSKNPKIELSDKKPVWITNKYSRQLVHKWRSEEMAILVGTQTVLDDNPGLDVRSWTGPSPVRIVLDRTNRITDDYSVKNHKIKSIFLTETSNLPNLDNLLYESIAFDDKLPKNIANVLFKHNLQSVIVEGGRKTLQTFIDANLWDEARVFKGTSVFNDGTPAPQFAAKPIRREMILDDELIIYRNYGAGNYI